MPVRVAYYAGTIAPYVKLEITGDPASSEFVREQVARAVQSAAGLRPGAQVLVTPDDVPFRGFAGPRRRGRVQRSGSHSGQRRF